MAKICNRFIDTTSIGGDGIGLCDGNEHVIEECFIDLSKNKLSAIDEALGITWGCSATVRNCVIRGAGKLILCGSGDAERADDEYGKNVTFERCILENFSRRGPEVQCGMQVTLRECMIKNWGDPDRFTVRNFGAWAHGEGSKITAERCLFIQDAGIFTRDFFADLIGHIGQAVNDGGFFRFFTKEAWQPGRCRGLVATAGGSVSAKDCHKNRWWISLQNRNGKMSKEEVEYLINELEYMRNSVMRGAK